MSSIDCVELMSEVVHACDFDEPVTNAIICLRIAEVLGLALLPALGRLIQVQRIQCKDYVIKHNV